MVNLLLPLLDEKGITDVKIIYGTKRIGDVMRNFSDTTKARKYLEWKVQTSLSEGLEKTLGWFLQTSAQLKGP